MAEGCQYVIIWQYEVANADRAPFEGAYGPYGDWVRLFSTAKGFIATELLAGGDGRYMTFDRWRSEADFRAFEAENGEAYSALDKRLERLTQSKERIGDFEVVA